MIDWSIDDRGIASITLDRSTHRNAIAIAEWRRLVSAAGALAVSDARVVILHSVTPGMFSAGADLTDLAKLIDAPAAPFREAMRAGIDAVAALPMPVIAAVDGGCYGAAVALALACDLRVAGDGAMFATTPAKLGLGYPGEDVGRLIAHVGRGQAARMLLTASVIDADEACRIGLAELRVPDALAEARRQADVMTALAPGSLRMLKRTLADPGGADVAWEFDAAFAGNEFAERLAAFRGRGR